MLLHSDVVIEIGNSWERYHVVVDCVSIVFMLYLCIFMMACCIFSFRRTFAKVSHNRMIGSELLVMSHIRAF